MFFSFKEQKYSLKQPAFIVGNGINQVLIPRSEKENPFSWEKLLFDTIPKDFKIKSGISELAPVAMDLTYPEIAELAKTLRKNSTTDNSISLQRKVCQIVNDWDNEIVKMNTSSLQSNFVKYSKENNIPILTTNYNYSLLNSLKIERKKIRKYFGEDFIQIPTVLKYKESKGRKRPDFLYTCFSEQPLDSFSDVCSTFAVWYIHGMKQYLSSICLTNSSYVNLISRIKPLIESGKNKDSFWDGCSSWVNIFMNNDLIIIGLSLKYHELDLRWLLNEREKYQNFLITNGLIDLKDKPKTLYLYADEDMSYWQSMFLKTLGVECIKFTNYESLYRCDYLS